MLLKAPRIDGDLSQLNKACKIRKLLSEFGQSFKDITIRTTMMTTQMVKLPVMAVSKSMAMILLSFFNKLFDQRSV